jgi:hypothetical protein
MRGLLQEAYLDIHDVQSACAEQSIETFWYFLVPIPILFPEKDYANEITKASSFVLRLTSGHISCSWTTIGIKLKQEKYSYWALTVTVEKQYSWPASSILLLMRSVIYHWTLCWIWIIWQRLLCDGSGSGTRFCICISAAIFLMRCSWTILGMEMYHLIWPKECCVEQARATDFWT